MRSVSRLVCAIALCLAVVPAAVSPAMAQAQSCQDDFAKIMGARQSIIQRINGFRTKRPTPQQACAAFNQLRSADARLISWMTTNKDWCQIPDDALTNAQNSQAQAAKIRGQACGAAAKQQQMQTQMRRQQELQAQGGGAPAQPGSGIRLPQGAL